MEHIDFFVQSTALAVGLFLGMLGFMEIGRRLAIRRYDKRGEDSRAGVGVVDRAIYTLLAILFGFAFNGAAVRFDAHRHLVIEQANAMSTAWDRVDLLPVSAQGPIRAAFQKYLDALLASYSSPEGSAQERNAREQMEKARKIVWSGTIAAVLKPAGEQARMPLIGSINEMFDAEEREYMSRRLRPSAIMYFMLGLNAMAAALFAGYAMANRATRNWLYTIGVAATVSSATWVIVELDNPRLGLIRVDRMNRVLEDVRGSMFAVPTDRSP